MYDKIFIPSLVFYLFFQINLSAQPCPEGGNIFGGHGVPDTVLAPIDPKCEECLKNCLPGTPLYQDETGAYFCIQVIRPIDPNDIIGPRGYGEARWVSVMDTLDYTIRYENDPKFATAPARNVIIEHAFDKNVDSTSFRLGPFGFGYFAFTIPGQRTYYSTRLDVIDSLGVMVDVSAGLNIIENNTQWEFISVNPLTGLNFVNALDGFLPVNDSTHQGEGFVTFTVLPKDGLETGDTVYAEASIIFDDNETITTNRYFNTIDADPPESRILGYDFVNDSTIKIHASAGDDASGLHHFELYASSNNVYTLVDTSGAENATFTFTGAKDSTYCFLTIAVDSVGNTEVRQQSYPCFPLAQDTLPRITDFNPKMGIPLTEVIIDGRNFTDLDSVLFQNYKAEVIAHDDTSITAKAPYPGETGKITVYTANGMAESSIDFVYEDPTGLGTGTENKIILYPNTTGGIFNISTQAEQLPTGILYVYDATGRIIKEVDFSQLRSNETTIDISHMPKGVYFVRLIGNKPFISRVIKE